MACLPSLVVVSRTYPLNKATTLSIPDVVDTMSNLWTLSNKRRTSSKNVAGELGLNIAAVECIAKEKHFREMQGSRWLKMGIATCCRAGQNPCGVVKWSVLLADAVIDVSYDMAHFAQASCNAIGREMTQQMTK
jgi:hypothetical protein